MVDINVKANELFKICEENNLDIALIKKAYQKAFDLHKTQTRKDGTPYIVHPIAVAIILAKLNFESNVIAGALLHDTIEDCDYTKQEMIQDFNKVVFNLVDCVSAIDNTKYIFNKENIFEDENFQKSSIEEQTFKKLICIGKNNPGGFAIKFADRLNNLRTIETFAYNKQLEKVKETEKWVIPIAKILNSEYFYRALKNECFKITNLYLARKYLDEYNYYHSSNKQNIENLYTYLKNTCSAWCTEIKIKDIREYKVFEDIQKENKNVTLQIITQSQILKAPNYNIYMLYNNGDQIEITQKIVNLISKNNKLHILDARMGGFTNRPLFLVEDDNINKYNLYIIKKDEYYRQRNGTMDSSSTNLIDDENINDLEQDLIKVKTRSGEVKYIPNNSTVLDFAFKLHKDIGFGFVSAIINNSKSKLPAYTKLKQNDKIEIVLERDENGKIVNKVQLKWFAYVNTELAKKHLIKYFEKTINEDRITKE